jgi:hypothetical protein
VTLYPQRRFLWGIPLLAAALLAFLAWWSNRAVRRTIEATLQTALQAGLNANVTALDIWINTQTRLAAVVTDDPDLQAAIAALLARTADRSLDRRRLEATPEAQTVQRLLDQRIRSSGFGAALVIGTNLQTVGTSSRARPRLGTPVETEHAARVQDVFANGRPVLVTPFKAGFGRPRGPGGPGGRGRFGIPATPSFPGSTNALDAAGRGRNPGGESRGSVRRFGPGFLPDSSTNGPGSPPSPSGPRGLGASSESGPGFGPGGPPRGDFNLMEVLAPVRNPAGEVIAAIAFLLRPDEEFTKVLSVARPGESVETFAFDAAGRLISESRFNEQLVRLGLLTNTPGVSSSLNLELRDPGADLTRGQSPTPGEASNRPVIALVSRAIAGETGLSLVPERDYRGVPVVGAFQWLPERNFGVAIKVDAAEAFRPLLLLRVIFAVLLVLLLVGTFIALVSSYGNLVWRRRFDEARLKALKLGQYTLAERIGEGGMGVVYRASHALLRRETAIKLLLPERADEVLVRQFEHEVQLTCGLSHPNTIQIYDYGHTADGIFYYAMELLRGMTLHELVERHGALPEERIIHLLIQACGSLQEAHSNGLIHRDIKPGNLFLCERGGLPDTLKVLDFGLVRRFGEGAAEGRPIRVEGTPLYMAPETLDHPGAGDPRSDLYALGAVAYLLITGQSVFAGESMDAILGHHRKTAPEPCNQRRPDACSPELEALVLRCLEKDPSRRPQTAGELMLALGRCPKAGDWTPARRSVWWRHHVSAEHGVGMPGARAGEATVKIDLGGRGV